MRYLRICVIGIFIASICFFSWANVRYRSGLNADMPTITSDTDLLKVSVKDGPEALLQGLTAQDETDGDLTSRIMVASISHFVEENTVNVKYVVFDTHNNAASFTRKVQYTDYESPRFTLSEPAAFVRGRNFDLLSRVQVNDCIDGDISDRIRVVSNMVNTYAAGVYPVLLEVTNSCGDMSQITLWVSVLDRENSVSIALDEYIVYVEQGGSFDPYSHIRSVTDGNNVSLPKANVQVKGSLDMNTPDTYRLEFVYSDQKGSGQAAMTVVVRSREGAS